MALNKMIEWNNGVTANYHKISWFEVNVKDDIKIQVESYVSKDTRYAEKNPVFTSTFSIPNETWFEGWKEGELISGSKLYDYLKSEEFFADAVDD